MRIKYEQQLTNDCKNIYYERDIDDHGNDDDD